MEFEEMQKLQQSINTTKRLLDTGYNTYTGLRDTNNSFQGLLNGMFENNQKLISMFEGIEEKLSEEERNTAIEAVTYVTKSNEVLLQLLKVNRTIETSLNNNLTEISREILTYTKGQ